MCGSIDLTNPLWHENYRRPRNGELKCQYDHPLTVVLPAHSGKVWRNARAPATNARQVARERGVGTFNDLIGGVDNLTLLRCHNHGARAWMGEISPHLAYDAPAAEHRDRINA